MHNISITQEMGAGGTAGLAGLPQPVQNGDPPRGVPHCPQYLGVSDRTVIPAGMSAALTPAASVTGRPVGTPAGAPDCCAGAAAGTACGGGSGGAAWTGAAAGSWLTGGAAARGVYWNCIVMPEAIPGGTVTCIICPSGAWTCMSCPADTPGGMMALAVAVEELGKEGGCGCGCDCGCGAVRGVYCTVIDIPALSPGGTCTCIIWPSGLGVWTWITCPGATPGGMVTAIVAGGLESVRPLVASGPGPGEELWASGRPPPAVERSR